MSVLYWLISVHLQHEASKLWAWQKTWVGFLVLHLPFQPLWEAFMACLVYRALALETQFSSSSCFLCHKTEKIINSIETCFGKLAWGKWGLMRYKFNFLFAMVQRLITTIEQSSPRRSWSKKGSLLNWGKLRVLCRKKLLQELKC